MYFNPRSLAGATLLLRVFHLLLIISIHAPSRERHTSLKSNMTKLKFQSTLPRGSDNMLKSITLYNSHISIHAPSRERQIFHYVNDTFGKFQSTLPRGSDLNIFTSIIIIFHFNPRSLAGATSLAAGPYARAKFQSTLPRGSDYCVINNIDIFRLFQSTLPRGSDHNWLKMLDSK